MMRLAAAAFVIARRDYVATVWSRTFLLFLIGPLLPLAFGVGYGALTAAEGRPEAPAVALAMGTRDAAAMLAARARLAGLQPGSLPDLVRGRGDKGAVTLSGTLDRPLLTGPTEGLPGLARRLGPIVDQARMLQALVGPPPAPVAIATRETNRSADRPDDRRIDLARGGQFVLFFLTMLLAGMMISNLVEEKSNKVIELLAAAVPVDAIFLGKLVGMLGVSLTGIIVWTAIGALAAGALPPGLALATPAVGWPIFLVLGLCYFATVYLLVGALYLGVGAQAGSMREVQSLSMPLTMGQLVIFAVASATIGRPADALMLAGGIIPWTSPFVLFARAALWPDVWPHLLALAWQIVALIVMVRIGARMFRRTVLDSGRSRPRQTPVGILRGWFRGGRA